MNAAGQRSSHRTYDAMAAHVNHAGTIGALPHKQLGRRTGLGERQQQRHVLALEHAHKIQATRVRGYANAYRVLLPWVLPMIEGEARAAERPATAAEPAPAPASPPISLYANLDHHPDI